MRPRLLKTTGVGMGLGVLLGAPACESQVGAAYEGEVQFSITGTVHGAESGWRPRLAFLAQNEVVFVDGTVTGSFPSKFRFDVTRAPPAEALASALPGLPYLGNLAAAYLVMMPEGTPDRLPFLEVTRDQVCGGPAGACVGNETACSPAGSCRERAFECEPCKEVAGLGDYALKQAIGTYTVMTAVVGSTAFEIKTFCESEANCYRVVAECEVTSQLAVADHGLQNCSISEESGDTSLVDPREFASTANQFVVAYATDPMVTDAGTLNKGYSLLEIPSLTREQVLAAPLECHTEGDATLCTPVFPFPRVVDGSDVNIELGLPPL